MHGGRVHQADPRRHLKPLAQLIVRALFGMTTPGLLLVCLTPATLRGNFWIAMALLRRAG
jgi:hypothetical protein